MILTDSSSAYAGSSVVKTIAGFGSNLYHFTTYGDTTLSRVVSGTGIGILKNGSAVLTLSAANTYTGNATISAGVMSIINTGALPGYNTNGRFAVAPNATLAVYNAVTDAEITTLRGTTNFKANSNLGFDTSSGNRTYTPAIANTSQGALGIVKLGQNTLIIPTVGTYTGSTSVLVGTLSTFGANIIPDSSPVFLDTNGTLILGGSDTLATISGRGTLNCQANNITLNSNNNSTFSGTLTSTANSGNCIYKQGTNTITLSGATARVAGPIRLDTGGITLAGNSSFIQNRTSGGPRDFQMALNGGTTFNLTISGGASLTTAGCMFGENNGGSATVNLLSGGTWNSGGGGGQTWMSGLSSILNIDGGAYSASYFYIGGGAAGITGIINLNSGTANLSGGIFIWQGSGRCVFNLNGGTVTFGSMSNGAVTDNTFNFNGGTFACAANNYNYNIGVVKYIVKSGGAIFNPPAGGSITLTTSVLSADSVSTGGGLVKNGAGTLFLGGALNTFTGQVSANEGMISVTSVNNNSTNGPLGNSNFPIVLGSNGKTGTLQYTTAANATTTKGIILPSGAIGTLDITGNANNFLTVGTISGLGSLVKKGIGYVGYAANTYSGGTTLIEGLNVVNSNSSFGTGTVNFNGGSLRSGSGVANITLSNNFILSAAATFPAVASERTLTLAGPVTMTRQVTMSVGIGATVTTEALIISGPIGDGGNAYQLNKTGAGVLVLSGQNTFSGPIIIQAGNMRILYPTIGDIRTTVGILQFAAGITNDISSSIRNNTQSVKIDTNGQNVTFASLLSSNSAGLVKTGTGTLILSATPIGTNTNAVRGSIISNAGTLSITGTLSSASRMAVSDVGGSTTGAITVSGTLIQTTGATGAVRALQIAAPAGTSGTFNVVSGGNVSLFSGCMLGENSGGNGTFNMTGGTVTTNGQFWFAGANSTLTVSSGILNCSSTMYIGGGGGTTTSTLTIAGGTISTPSNLNFGIGGATSTMTVNLNGGTLSCVTFEYNQGTATVNMNGGILSFTGAGNTPLASQFIFSVKSGGAIIDIPTSGRVVTIPSVLANGTGGGGLTKTGTGLLSLSAINTYTGTTNISTGTLRVVKKISGTGSDASFTQADFTPTTLSVTFVSLTPPSVGNTFRLFPGATQQTYGTVTLINYAGTASYDSTNSTLTINT